MPQLSDKRIFQALNDMYEAAKSGAPDQWVTVYKDISNILSCGPGALTAFLPRTNNFEMVASTADQEYLRAYEQHYQFVSPFRETLIKLKPGEYFSRIEVCTNEEYEKTEIYQDLFRKQDVYQYEYHPLSDLPDLKGGISLSRPRSNVSFTANERAVINFLLPHLQRAFQLHLALTRVQSERMQMTEALSRVAQSVIVLDRSAKVVFLNSAAEKTIAEKDGLELDRHMCLFASSSSENKAFRAALDAIFVESLEKLADPGGVLQISRPSGGRPLQILIFPFTEPDFNSYSSEPLAMIFLYDPESRLAPVEDVLSQTYGLTPAESHVAALLAGGISLKEAGDELGVSLNTVKTHLKRIFTKTDTNRQSELITLLNNGPGQFNHGPAGDGKIKL